MMIAGETAASMKAAARAKSQGKAKAYLIVTATQAHSQSSGPKESRNTGPFKFRRFPIFIPKPDRIKITHWQRFWM